MKPVTTVYIYLLKKRIELKSIRKITDLNLDRKKHLTIHTHFF